MTKANPRALNERRRMASTRACDSLRRRAKSAAAVLLSAASIVSLSTRAHAESFATPTFRNVLSDPALGPVPGDFSSWRELFAEQARLNAAADRIDADPHARAHLAGIVADPTQHKLQVYWKGAVTTSTRRLLATVEREVVVAWFSAEFSHAELLAASEAVVSRPNVVQVSAKIDGSGLDVVLREASPLHSETVAHVNNDAGHSTHSVPLSYSYGEPIEPVFSRDADVAPYYGGSRYWIPSADQGCSTAFGVRRNSSSEAGWLTAGHCSGSPNRNSRPEPIPVFVGRGTGNQIDDDLGASFGNMWNRDVVWNNAEDDSNEDMAFITALNPADVGQWIYVGRPLGDSAAIPVAGVGVNRVGNFVFSSGASTGLNGALKIVAVDVTSTVTKDMFDPNWNPRDCRAPCTPQRIPALHDSHGVKAVHVGQDGQPDFASAAGKGDSGGAVFAFAPDGRALAMGIVHTTEGTVECPSDNRNAVRCSSTLFFADITRALKRFDVTLNTRNWP